MEEKLNKFIEKCQNKGLRYLGNNLGSDIDTFLKFSNGELQNFCRVGVSISFYSGTTTNVDTIYSICFYNKPISEELTGLYFKKQVCLMFRQDIIKTSLKDDLL